MDGGGIPSGLVANWLFHKLLRKRQARGDYFTVTYASGGIDFEGRVKTHISTEEIINRLLESAKNEPKSGDEKRIAASNENNLSRK